MGTMMATLGKLSSSSVLNLGHKSSRLEGLHEMAPRKRGVRQHLHVLVKLGKTIHYGVELGRPTLPYQHATTF